MDTCLQQESPVPDIRPPTVLNNPTLTHLASRDGRQDALVGPGSELSAMISNISNLVYIQPTDKCKIVLRGGRSWKQLCLHNGSHQVPDEEPQVPNN